MLAPFRIAALLFPVALHLWGCSTAPQGNISDDKSEESTRAAALNRTAEPSLGIGGHVEGLDLDCRLEENPSGGSCTPTDEESACQICVAARCCTEQAACNSLEPMNACAFGSRLLDGRLIEGGEIACMMECLADRATLGALAGDDTDIEACSSSCAASECGLESASSVSEELASCILGDDSKQDSGCRAECGLIP